MQAVLLSAGEGSRLSPLTSYIPKPLLPLAGKPLLARIMGGPMHTSEVGDPIIIVALDEFRDQFEYCLERWKEHVQLFTFPKPAGTAGELLRLSEYLKDEFLVYYADIWTEINLGRLIATWRRNPRVAIACLAVANRLKVDKGVAVLSGGRPPAEGMRTIKEIREKPDLEIPNLAGIGIFKKRILKYARAGEDLNATTVPAALASGEKVLAYPFAEGYWDIGSLSAFKQAQTRFNK